MTDFTDEELRQILALIKPDARGFYSIKNAELMKKTNAILNARIDRNLRQAMRECE